MMSVALLLIMTLCCKEINAFTTATSRSQDTLLCLNLNSVQDIRDTKRKDDTTCMIRRKLLINALHAPFIANVPCATAANLPQSTGADLSNTGTIETLIPIVKIKQTIESINSQLMSKSGNLSSDECKSILKSLVMTIPRNENDFKRIFDSYSTPVSYKQKFLDQNAFLVYYTQGFDGPGRPNIEDDAANNIQTLQYGARNDAWSAMDDVFVEFEYGQRSSDSDAGELRVLTQKVILALDTYLSLAPAADVEQACKY